MRTARPGGQSSARARKPRQTSMNSSRVYRGKRACRAKRERNSCGIFADLLQAASTIVCSRIPLERLLLVSRISPLSISPRSTE